MPLFQVECADPERNRAYKMKVRASDARGALDQLTDGGHICGNAVQITDNGEDLKATPPVEPFVKRPDPPVPPSLPTPERLLQEAAALRALLSGEAWMTEIERRVKRGVYRGVSSALAILMIFLFIVGVVLLFVIAAYSYPKAGG